MNIKSFFTGVLPLVFLIGCNSTPPYNPYKVDKSIISKNVKRIGVMPTSVLVATEGDKSDYFNSELVNTFENKGFEVVAPNEWVNIYKSIKEGSGDLYDPKTGEPNKEKLKSIRNKAREIYFNKFDVDAILYSGVMGVKANWNVNSATWDGVEESTTGKDGFWAHMTTPQAYGTIGALSFFVSIEDTQEKDLFLDFGGLQLRQHLSGRDFIPVEKEKILSDNNVNSNGIRLSTCRFFEIWEPPVKNKKGRIKGCRK